MHASTSHSFNRREPAVPLRGRDPRAVGWLRGEWLFIRDSLSSGHRRERSFFNATSVREHGGEFKNYDKPALSLCNLLKKANEHSQACAKKAYDEDPAKRLEILFQWRSKESGQTAGHGCETRRR